MANNERGACRLVAVAGQDGKPVIRVELFHQTVPFLANTTLEFELLGGTTLQQAKTLAESINDRIVGLAVVRP
ncbi:MAG: hypothetical protein JOY93_00725 [Acidobacteriales bacterium]|nr:hypothetical protein [Terriglobales bacterium]